MSNTRIQRVRRKNRVRAKIFGDLSCPRASVFRGSKTLVVQLIDDTAGLTLASVRDADLKKEFRKKTKTERAHALGLLLAERAKAEGISKIVFDRGSNRYHGRVKAVADAAREGGLEF